MNSRFEAAAADIDGSSSQLLNMSNGGLMAIADEEVAVGTWLGAEIPGRGIVIVQVRRFEGGMLGAQYEEPLTVQRVI